jgi:restriction system protein
MANPALDQLVRSLMWMMLPVVVLAGFANTLGKGRKLRGRRTRAVNRNGLTSGRKAGWADDLVLAPWWVSFGLAVVVFALLPVLLPPPIHGLSPLIGLFLLFLSGISALRSWKTTRMLDGQTGLDSLRELPWKRFEDLLGEAYRRQGYSVTEMLGGGADGGVDLVLRRNGSVTLVQCKRWKDRPVPVQTVRELYGVLHAQRAGAAKLVATTHFTSEAVAFANGKPIELVDANALLQLLHSVQALGKIVLPPAGERDHLAPSCPRCGAKMKMRLAKHGTHAGERFWGCSNYPNCRGTREI